MRRRSKLNKSAGRAYDISCRAFTKYPAFFTLTAKRTAKKNAIEVGLLVWLASGVILHKLISGIHNVTAFCTPERSSARSPRQFGSRHGVMRRSALYAFLFSFLAMFARGAISENGSSSSSTNVPGGKHTFLLHYAERATTASVFFSRLRFEGREVSFRKEPDFQGDKVFRSFLSLGKEKKTYIPFAWDVTQGKLFLDLNRNMDLTDDPDGVFTCPNKGPSYLQIFAPVRLSAPQGQTQLDYLISLRLYQRGSGAYSYMSVLSSWSNAIELHGEKWYLEIVDNLDGEIGAALFAERNDCFIIRPYDSSGVPGTFLPEGDPRFIASIEPPQRLFLDQHAYNLSYSFEPGETGPDLKVVFEEAAPELAWLRLTGSAIKTLVLKGDTLVVLDSPKRMVKVPAGTYRTEWAQLQSPDRRLQPVGLLYETVHLTATTPAVLDVGGPLNNSVKPRRDGQSLVLEYELTGAGGTVYRQINQDRNHPPTLVIYRNGKTVCSGSFSYG
jgi:hypothetical protein